MSVNNISLGLASAFILLICALDRAGSEDKWVWEKDSDRASRKIGGRYEIYEPDGPEPAVAPQGAQPGNYAPGNHRPHRPPGPGSFGPPPPAPYPHRYGYGGPNGVLVGPTPHDRTPFEYIESCRCTERFNCGGLAYGTCDTGRQYCCVGGRSGPPPSRPVHSAENGILVGPGGPLDGFRRPFRRGDREGYGQEVLVGPGGPTGIVGPPHNGGGPGFGIGNGVLVGPGYNTGYAGGLGSYGRSANAKQ